MNKSVVGAPATPQRSNAWRAQQAAVEWIRLADVVRVMALVGRDPGSGMFHSLVEARERYEAARRLAWLDRFTAGLDL